MNSNSDNPGKSIVKIADHHQQLTSEDEFTALLNHLDGIATNWSYFIRNIVQVGECVVVTAAIRIKGTMREGIGISLTYTPNGIKQAERDSLRQAALKFSGVRELLPNGFDDRNLSDPADNANGKCQFNPIAKTQGELISIQQLSRIKSLARRTQIDPEAACQELYQANLGEISRRAASALIEHIESRIPILFR